MINDTSRNDFGMFRKDSPNNLSWKQLMKTLANNFQWDCSQPGGNGPWLKHSIVLSAVPRAHFQLSAPERVYEDMWSWILLRWESSYPKLFLFMNSGYHLCDTRLFSNHLIYGPRPKIWRYRIISCGVFVHCAHEMMKILTWIITTSPRYFDNPRRCRCDHLIGNSRQFRFRWAIS